MRVRQRLKCARRGMTLLEVVIALTIFLFSLVALSHLVSLGNERALEVQQQAHASMLCQSKLAELVAGSETLGSSGLSPFPDDTAPPNSPFANFQYQIEASESDIPNLWNVTVIVQKDRGDGRVLEVQLSQMVLDPSARGNATTSGSTSSTSSSMGSK